MRLILASTSPRRREIMALLGIPFEVIAPEFDEIVSADLAIDKEVLEFAVGKARSVAKRQPNSIVIGSDTMISLEREKIGKPTDKADAARMLRLLSGKSHTILTSVAILDGTGGPGLRTVERVFVDMQPYAESDIESYLAFDESMDKAGAYSIQGQGSKFIASIRGDYLAAVGMPLIAIARYLKERGMSFGIDVDKLYADKAALNWRTFA